MAKPALVVVYEDREVLAALDQALQSRFGADYQVLAATTPVAALDTLGRLREAGEQVALVRWSFSRSFHRPQLHPTRPDSPESSTNLSCLDPTGQV
jgi:hypothetical protein